MTRPPPHEMFPSERTDCSSSVRSSPVLSDFARERSYAFRRMMTLCVLGFIVLGTLYALWRHHSSDPSVIPTIKADGAYKQKPADPGGIDIPHQDVRVYDELEGKNAPPSSTVEHLLPLPEVPENVPHVTVPITPPSTPIPVPPIATTPSSAPAITSKDVLGLPPPPSKLLNTTLVAPTPAPLTSVAETPPPSSPAVAPTPVPTLPVSPVKETLTIDQVIAETRSRTPSPVSSAPSSGSGHVVVQLASVEDQPKAQEMAINLQKKYASVLGDTHLSLTRADLGSRGVFYRIQSQSLSEDEANRICSSLKQMNAGCILVRK